jgi:hypothetical protein
MATLASAFLFALASGSAAVYANSKERIGIDNVDKCDQSLRDPECTNDEAVGAAQVTADTTPDESVGADEEETAALSNRSDNLDDAVGMYQNP